MISNLPDDAAERARADPSSNNDLCSKPNLLPTRASDAYTGPNTAAYAARSTPQARTMRSFALDDDEDTRPSGNGCLLLEAREPSRRISPVGPFHGDL